jgi:hypothetical protein
MSWVIWIMTRLQFELFTFCPWHSTKTYCLKCFWCPLVIPPHHRCKTWTKSMMAMIGLRWSQPILKIVLVLVPGRFNVWVTCVVCISIKIVSSILVFKMKLPRLENRPTSQWKDMSFSNLWVHSLFTNSTIPFHSM